MPRVALHRDKGLSRVMTFMKGQQAAACSQIRRADSGLLCL
jgi:hypothetical protein